MRALGWLVAGTGKIVPGLWLRPPGALPEEQQKLLRGYQREMVQFLSATLQGVAPEVFDSEADKLRAATMSVFGMLNWYYMWNSGAGPTAREDYAELVANLTLNGVRGL